jgi:DNA-binding CsgD family transcriptional regulator
MVSLDAFSELLEVLYSAPLDQEQWQRFLTLLCTHTRSKNGVFICADTCNGLAIRAIDGSLQDTQVTAEYNERYGNSDPFRAALIRKAEVGVFQGDDILPNGGLLQTNMYRELVYRLGLRYATLIPLTISVRRFETISVWRTPEMGPMDEDCNRLLGLLFPHIQKALQIRQVLGVTQQRLAGAEAIADATSTATFLLTREGHVIHSNAPADALVSDGSSLILRNGTLIATDAQSREALRAIFLKAASPSYAPSNVTPVHALSLPRTDGRQPLQLLATSLPHLRRGRSGADILVLVTDPERSSSFPDSVLRALYGLMPAETEVANGLLMGYSLEEIASLRRVTLGTVRIQMKSLLSKTGTSRQSELVRLLMALPQPPAAN